MDKSELMASLKEKGIKQVTATYSGSGDSGCVDVIEAFNEQKQSLKIEKTFHRQIEDYCYGILEDKHGGWELNEGSSGTITIDVNANKVTIEHEEYFTESKSSTTEL